MRVADVDPAAVQRLQRLGGPGLVLQMIELYLQQGGERMTQLRSAVAASDARQVERTAHAIKSSAGNLGVLALQRVAEALEVLAAQGVVDAELAGRAAAEYEASEAHLRRVAAELRA